MGFVVIWFLFGLVSGVAASNKGNSGLFGFILGCVLGPFGLLIVLVSKGQNPPQKSQQIFAYDGTKKCPFCAEDIKSEAIVCKHCQRDIPLEGL